MSPSTAALKVAHFELSVPPVLSVATHVPPMPLNATGVRISLAGVRRNVLLSSEGRLPPDEGADETAYWVRKPAR